MSFGNNIVFLLRFALVAIIFGVCWGVSFAQTSSDVAPQTFARIDETHESKSTQSVTDSDRVLVTNESADTSKTKEKNYSEKRNAEIVFDEYQQRLEDLAKKCDELSMPLEAKVTRSLIYPDNTEIFTIPLLPVQETLRKLPADANKNQRFWFSALNRLRGQYSDEIYSFAEYFGDKKRGYDVVACVLTTLFVNPDHTKARHFFNYTLQDGVWRSRWELQQLEKGLVETPEFGWLPAENVDRYRNGERFYKRQWISSQEEEKRILASASGWRVDTEHFSILSRVSLERGVEIGRLLEAYYQAFYDKANPDVYLICNGTEEGKGNTLSKETYALLKKEKNFKGYMEGRDVFSGKADVVVFDGFTGNVFLKGSEGMAKMMGGLMKDAFLSSLSSKIGYLFAKKGLKGMLETMNYKRVGGALLIGINKVAVKAHGNADEESFYGSLNVAYTSAKKQTVQKIKENLKI